MPYHLFGTIVVPDLTVHQKITGIPCRIISQSALKAYEHKALRHIVRIVRSNPHTVRSVFQFHVMKQARLPTRLECRCAAFQPLAEQFGTWINIQGRVALIPLRLDIGGHSY